MSYMNLEYGFVMDENTKEVFRVKDGVLLESSPEEYERLQQYNTRRRTLWSDSIRVDALPEDTMLDDDTDMYFSIDNTCISIYREFKDPEPYIAMICIENLEDLQFSGLSGRGKAAIVKLIGLVKDYVIDNEWHNELNEFNNKTYKISYKIDGSNVLLGIKKITMGKKVRVKNNASSVLNF